MSLKSVTQSLKYQKQQFHSIRVAKQSGFVAGLYLLLSANMPSTRAQNSTTPSPEVGTASPVLPIPVAPDATNPGPLTTTATEYRFPPTIDPDIIGDRVTEIWAVVHRPAHLFSRPYPVITFLHGNHATCGRGSNPRIDDNIEYSSTGNCPSGYVVVPNHRGYDYLARRLASWGYVVVSINANRGINASPGVADDAGLNLARGRLILKHLQLLSSWNTGSGTPDSLGVDLQGKLNFNNLGLMGHSRGGEGVRAAYNLYRNQNSPWVSRIPDKLGFKGIFEFAPVDGQTSRTLNAGSVAWNVLLPQCDGDVSDLQGVKPFDRMLRLFREGTPTPKSTYTVWGANHNYYNTQWQTSDSDFCLNHQAIFTPGLSVGSAPQRLTGLASLLAFMRGNIPGSQGFNPIFRQNFNPQFALPEVVTSVTRVDRGYTSSPNAAVTRVLEDFNRPTGTNSAGFSNIASNINIVHDLVPEHDPSLRAGVISWFRPSNNVYFQTNVASVGQGVNISAYKTLDLRLENQEYSNTPTNFEVALVRTDGTLSQPVPIRKYVNLRGPVGGPGGTHRMLQTARISLSDFGVSLKNVRGVRLTFNKTGQGAIYVANMRLSSISERGEGSFFLPESQSTLANQTLRAQEQPTVITDGNRIISIRRVNSSATLRTQSSAVEIEVASNQPFPVRNELPVLRIGKREIVLSRYPSNGDLNRLIFTLPEEEFAQVSSSEDVSVQYGRGDSTLRWSFGRMDKSMLN
jgi:hypothetical protein